VADGNENVAGRLLNVKEAAAFLGIGVQTLYNRISQRTINHVKIGRRVLFPMPLI
jgi:excisionase family DNA binding protein